MMTALHETEFKQCHSIFYKGHRELKDESNGKRRTMYDETHLSIYI